MRTHPHECLSITVLLAGLAASGCKITASMPTAGSVASVDPSGDDSGAGSPAGDPASFGPDAGGSTGDDESDPVNSRIGAVVEGGTGLIIPAYLGVDSSQTDRWKAIADGAATLQDGGSAHKDYWVTVTAGVNGEMKQTFDWTSAKLVWDPVRANGGAIFGYVHTSQKWVTGPNKTCVDALLFRPIADVEADIAAWVSGYPNIDGIWIDEFYPRHEIADDCSPPMHMFPNGRDAAPPEEDPSYVSPDGGLNASVNIKPTGGYYATLTNWIRDNYSNLKIVGNAGGPLWSNQHFYANLVTVVCTFENSYQTAAANNWAELQRRNYYNQYPQLALIHTNPNDMAGALKKAFDLGYTHAYTTDEPYMINGVPHDVWGALPLYFATEVSAVASPP